LSVIKLILILIFVIDIAGIALLLAIDIWPITRSGEMSDEGRSINLAEWVSKGTISRKVLELLIGPYCKPYLASLQHQQEQGN
jgi:hypothetical protein